LEHTPPHGKLSGAVRRGRERSKEASVVNRVARAVVLPFTVLAAMASTVTVATASTAAWPESCAGEYSYGKTRVTVRCNTSEPGTRFQAVAFCPHGYSYGPIVLQGPPHVSVATCASAMDSYGWLDQP
jgi:hypothetical protein